MQECLMDNNVERSYAATEPPLGTCSPLLVSQVHAASAATAPQASSVERAMWSHDDRTSVRVALRARPLVPRERLEGAKACVTVDEAAGAVALGSQRRFVFDHAFGTHSTQDQVYDTCVSDLVDAVVEGYNATVLAYGPTGSGKTYTMGTGSALHCMPEQQGIIPRVIRQLFNVIQQSGSDRSFVVKAQFLEIYNEEVRDLLAPPGSQAVSTGGGAVPFSIGNSVFSSKLDSSSLAGVGPLGGQRSSVAIRECPDGQIIVTGAREEVASSYEELVHLLDCGTLARATGATSLNQQSSRSHAIFTVIVEQSIHANSSKQEGNQQPVQAGSIESSDSSAEAHQRPESCHSSSSPLTPRARLLQQLNQSGSATAPADAADINPLQDSSHTSSSMSSSRDCSSSDVWGSGGGSEEPLEMEYRCAKFHLVDLAGSERTKRSGAVGARFKETVTINQGLLALGNVISALGDDKRRLPSRHVPYRDSKLTRLLQDSLGGNSKTLMIACVSSADDVLEENLNTLKYASRARHIRNRPVVNRQHLGSSNGSIAVDVQALQLLLLRRFAQQVLGPLISTAVPKLLLADASRCGEAASLRMLRELQALAAFPKAALDGGIMHDILRHDQGQQQHKQLVDNLRQQLADLEAQLTMSRMQAAAFEVQLDAVEYEKAVSDQTAAEAQQQQNNAKQQLLAELDQLHAQGTIGPAVRNQLCQLVLKLLKRPDTQQPGSASCDAAVQHARRASVHSHPLPMLDMSCCDDTTAETIRAAARAAAAGGQGGSDSQQTVEALQQDVDDLKRQLADTTIQLYTAQQDLAHDEDIFAQRVMEMTRLRDEMAAMAAAAQQERTAATRQIQHLQADIRRWRTRALALQGCTAVDTASADTKRASAIAAAASATTAENPSPSSPDSLVVELSFAAFTGHQQQQQAASKGATLQAAAAVDYHTHILHTSTQPDSKDLDLSDATGSDDTVDDREDQVLFDDELASYISDTDYTDLMAEDSHHLLAELQAVLADKAALEEERTEALAEAAAAQQSFERSRALLESQLTQLSTAISSQEMLISTLQNNEAEARQMGALYLERCRELEAELAELQLDLEELTAALARVEADVAASADEKQRLRTEYEGKIQTVVEQMSGLQRQLKGHQDVSRVDRERQRAAQQVQQLQGHLTAMRAEQDALRKRLHERLLSQEKAAAERSKEMAALRRAADAAKKRVNQLEQQARRQQAELRARAAEAAAAQRQLKQMETQATMSCSKQGVSPRATTRARTPSQSLRASLRGSNSSSTTTLDRAYTPKSSRHALTSRRSTSQSSITAEPAGCSIRSSKAHTIADLGTIALATAADDGSLSAPNGCQRGKNSVHGRYQQGEPTASHSLNSSIVSMTCIKMSTWLKSQLQLLAVKQAAEEQLQQLQARHAAAANDREQLLATKATIDIKQLRKAWSGNRNSNRSDDGMNSSTSHQTSLSDTEQCLLEGLLDQLDASNAELDHLQQQMQEQQAQAAAADEAIAQLRAQVPHMSAKELAVLLQQALDVLVEQGSVNEATTSKAGRMELGLVETQQQLEEVASCLHTTQLQHQAQVADLQRQHEQRVMQLIKESATAVEVKSEHKRPNNCSVPAELSPTGNTAAETAAQMANSRLCNLTLPQQPNLASNAATIASYFSGAGAGESVTEQKANCSTVAALIGTAQVAGTQGTACQWEDSQKSCDQHTHTAQAAVADKHPMENEGQLAQPNSSTPHSTGGTGCCSSLQHSVAQLLHGNRKSLEVMDTCAQAVAARSQQLGTKAWSASQPAAAATPVADSNQRRPSSRQGSPARGPQLSDLMACLAHKPPTCHQLMGRQVVVQESISPGNRHQQLGLQQQKQLSDMAVALRHELQQMKQPDNSSSNRSPLPADSQEACQQPVNSADSSPSKLQAKLAAYRSHLKQASPQKVVSASVDDHAAAAAAATATASTCGPMPAAAAAVVLHDIAAAAATLPPTQAQDREGSAAISAKCNSSSSFAGVAGNITSGSLGKHVGRLRPLPGYRSLCASPQQQQQKRGAWAERTGSSSNGAAVSSSMTYEGFGCSTEKQPTAGKSSANSGKSHVGQMPSGPVLKPLGLVRARAVDDVAVCDPVGAAKRAAAAAAMALLHNATMYSDADDCDQLQ